MLSLPQARFTDWEVDVAGVTDPAEAYFKDGQWGWDGTQWRKLPLLWGFSGQILENLGGAKSGAGTYSGVSTAVPAGEIHVITLASITNVSGARGATEITITVPTYYPRLAWTLTPGISQPTIFSGHVYLAEGNRISCTQYTCLDGDQIRAAVIGYKMSIAE